MQPNTITVGLVEGTRQEQERQQLLGPLPIDSHTQSKSTSTACARYASSDQAILDSFTGTDAFGKLMKAAVEVANQQAEMPAADVAAMFIALAQFTGTVYPDRLDYVDYVLTSCYQAIPPAIRLDCPRIHGPFITSTSTGVS